MKKYLLILTLLFGSFSMAFAQENQQGDDATRQEKIQALYVAYVTQQLQLTPEEAQKFWPVHAQFDAEMKAIHQKEYMPELQREEAVLGVKKKFQERFTKILGNNRTDNFYRKDIQFSAKLVERLRKMRQQNNINQRPMRRKPGM